MTDYYDFKVTLMHTKPKIWRRFLLHPDATFQDLHEAIQDSFGWEYAHLWNFTTKGRGREVIAEMRYEDSYFGDFSQGPDAASVALSSHFERNKRSIYMYDFGDGWEHDVMCHKRRVRRDEDFWRRLLGGEQVGPPEDCGGVWGYEELRKLMKLPKEKLDEWDLERVQWLEDYGWSEEFDLEEVRAFFDMDMPPGDEGDDLEDLQALLEAMDPRIAQVLDELPDAMGQMQYPEELIRIAQQAWIDYVYTADPSPRKPAIYAASLHYTMTLLMPEFFGQPTQADLAHAYATSVASISKTYPELYDVLDESMRQQTKQALHELFEDEETQQMVSQMGRDDMSFDELVELYGEVPDFESVPKRANSVWEFGVFDMGDIDMIVGVDRETQGVVTMVPTSGNMGTAGLFFAITLAVKDLGWRPGRVALAESGPTGALKEVLGEMGIEVDEGGVVALDDPAWREG